MVVHNFGVQWGKLSLRREKGKRLLRRCRQQIRGVGLWHFEVAVRGVDECMGGSRRDQPTGHEGDSGALGSWPLRQQGTAQFHGARAVDLRLQW